MDRLEFVKKYAVIGAIALLAVFSGCGGGGGGEGPESVFPPRNLAASEITSSSATLIWDGDAAVYELRLSDREVLTVNGKRHNAVSLTPDTEYTWSVRSVGEGGTYSEWVNGPGFKTVQSSDPEKPAQPTSLTSDMITSSSARLQWQGSASGYEVMVGETAYDAGSASFDVFGLAEDTVYEWQVRAKEGELYSDWVFGGSFITLLSKPSSPETTNVTSFSALLKWGGAAERYEVEVNGVTVPVSAKEYLAEGLTSDKDYTWKVRAVSDDNNSEWVEGPAFKTLDGPALPYDLRIDGLEAKRVVLLWLGEADSYELEVGDDIKETITWDSQYITNALTPSTNYTWRVRAVKNGVFSDWVDGPHFATYPEDPAAVENYGRAEFGGQSWVLDRFAVDRIFYHERYNLAGNVYWHTQPNREFPRMQFFMHDDVKVYEYPFEGNGLYVEYYDEYADDERKMYKGATYEGQYGNWWVRSGSFEIVSLNTVDGTASVSMDFIMYDAYATEMQGSTDPATMRMSLTFTKVAYRLVNNP